MDILQRRNLLPGSAVVSCPSGARRLNHKSPADATMGGGRSHRRRGSYDVQGHRLNAGHFFPEEDPEQTAEVLGGFFGVPG
jgi:hypothetical protein